MRLFEILQEGIHLHSCTEFARYLNSRIDYLSNVRNKNYPEYEREKAIIGQEINDNAEVVIACTLGNNKLDAEFRILKDLLT